MSNISIRYLEQKDAPLMLEWMKDSSVNRNFRFDSENITEASASDFISRSQGSKTDYHFAIVDDTDEYLGTVSLKGVDITAKTAEYAIVLRKVAQGKGYGYAATTQVLEYAFYSLGLERVYLNVFADNTAAVTFYEKYGFICEGEFMNHIFAHGKGHSLKWYRMMKNEYEKIRESRK